MVLSYPVGKSVSGHILNHLEVFCQYDNTLKCNSVVLPKDKVTGGYLLLFCHQEEGVKLIASPLTDYTGGDDSPVPARGFRPDIPYH